MPRWKAWSEGKIPRLAVTPTLTCDHDFHMELPVFLLPQSNFELNRGSHWVPIDKISNEFSRNSFRQCQSFGSRCDVLNIVLTSRMCCPLSFRKPLNSRAILPKPALTSGSNRQKGYIKTSFDSALRPVFTDRIILKTQSPASYPPLCASSRPQSGCTFQCALNWNAPAGCSPF